MRIGVYAGTFDPITWGHVSVIERAAQLFDNLVVVVAINPNKTPLFDVPERLALIRAVTARWPNVECAFTEGYVVEFAKARGAQHLVRGVRDATDTEAELKLANENRRLAPEIETLFVPATAHLAEVSSSRLKELARAGTDLSALCPPVVAERLRERACPDGEVLSGLAGC